MSELVSNITNSTWENEVLKADTPVLVDFWAPWCAPCRMIAPAVDAVAEKYQGKAKVVKLNVDENPETSAKYDVRGIPTLILFNNGEVVDRQVGVPPNVSDALSKMIEKKLA